MADVTFSGPLFDGTAARAARDGTTAARRKIAEQGAKTAARLIASSARTHRTGRAERSVVTTDVSRPYQTGKYTLPVVVDAGDTVVTSDLATYGPWLEGTGSRNETTRFKGYHSFRLAAQELDRQVPEIAQAAFAPYLGRMQ